jgi:peptidoglycan/LPS O-acetylase OafA/YrhL
MFNASTIAVDSAPPPVRSLSYQELDVLHCLRGFCAFYVLVYHAKYVLWSGGRAYLATSPLKTWSAGQYLAFAFDMLSSAGFEMVISFFVLSGFFIRYAQLRKHRAMGAFYVNRLVRIYPPYLASLALSAVALFIIARFVPQMLTTAGNRELNSSLQVAWYDLQHLTWDGTLRTLVFLPVKGAIYFGYNSVYWSLLPEALFYLVVPLAFWRIRQYYIVSTLLYLVGIATGLMHYSWGPLTDYFLIYNFYFATGAAVYDAVTQTEWLAWFRRLPGWLLGGVVGALFVLLLYLSLLEARVFSGLVAVLLAVLAVSALLAGRVSQKNLALRFFHPIGIYSFSLYLCHFPLLLLSCAAMVALTGQIVFYARFYWLFVPLVTLGCYAFYWMTERVSVNFFRRI